jgi:hypothetical protein
MVQLEFVFTLDTHYLSKIIMNDKSWSYSLHPCLEKASLDEVSNMADILVRYFDARIKPNIDPRQVAFDLSYMIEYLRLNFDLVTKK